MTPSLKIRFWCCAALWTLASCGPPCPQVGLNRADLPPNRTAGERRIDLETNVIAQVNARPGTLLLRLPGVEPRGQHFSIYFSTGLPSGPSAEKLAAELDASPEADGRYRIKLTQPGSSPLRSGIYRLHVETPEPLEVSFEIRSCTVYY